MLPNDQSASIPLQSVLYGRVCNAEVKLVCFVLMTERDLCHIFVLFCCFFQGFESGRGRVVAVAYAEVTLLIYYCGAPPSGQLKVV